MVSVFTHKDENFQPRAPSLKYANAQIDHPPISPVRR